MHIKKNYLQKNIYSRQYLPYESEQFLNLRKARYLRVKPLKIKFNILIRQDNKNRTIN